MHIEQLLAYLSGPAFAVAWAMILSDLFRNIKSARWTALDPSIKQLVMATLTIVVPMGLTSLIGHIPLETLKAADVYFYPIALVIGKIWFAYRQGKPTADTPLDKKLLEDLFGGVILPAKDS